MTEYELLKIANVIGEEYLAKEAGLIPEADLKKLRRALGFSRKMYSVLSANTNVAAAKVLSDRDTRKKIKNTVKNGINTDQMPLWR